MNIGDERLINEMDGEEKEVDVDLKKSAEAYVEGAPEQVAKSLNKEVKKLQDQKAPSAKEIRNFRVSTILKGSARLKDEDFTTYQGRRKFENKIKKIYLRGRVYDAEENTIPIS